MILEKMPQVSRVLCPFKQFYIDKNYVFGTKDDQSAFTRKKPIIVGSSECNNCKYFKGRELLLPSWNTLIKCKMEDREKKLKEIEKL